MLTTVLILSLLALSGVDADCSCYVTAGTTVTGRRTPVSNAFDDSTFGACYVNPCGFIADSGNSTVGWTNFTVTFSTITDPDAVFVLYDGKDDSANQSPIATVTTADSGKLIPLTSSTSSIYVKYTQSAEKTANQYYGTLMAVSGLAPPTTTAIPTTAPTTTPFVSTNYQINPQLISHDMLLLVNQRTDQGSAGLTALNNLATSFVNLLSVTNSFTKSEQTRLGLSTLTPYSPNYAPAGEIWKMSAQDVINALPKAGVSIDVDIVNALKTVVPAFFNVNDAIAPTRKSVQRSVVLFTAWWGTGDLDDAKAIFEQYGVNLAIIAFNTSSSLLVPNSWYNYAYLSNTLDSDVATFTNRFFLNSGFNNELVNNWCKRSTDPTSSSNTVFEPSDYKGPGSPGVSVWSATDGQTARYCNFQDTTYTYTRSDPSKNVNVTVFYELEIENDYLKFWADGAEIESFTGYDVNNAQFQVNATTITARFTTDHAGVQRGFYIKFDEASS